MLQKLLRKLFLIKLLNIAFCKSMQTILIYILNYYTLQILFNHHILLEKMPLHTENVAKGKVVTDEEYEE